MNPDMLQFQCGFCHTILTVPAQMAGVSGPCPSCGQTVTSPTPAPAAPPMQQWSPPPQWQLRHRHRRQLGRLHRCNPPCWVNCRAPACHRSSQTQGCHPNVPQGSRRSPLRCPPLPARCHGIPLRERPLWVPLMRLLDSLDQHCPISHASFLVLLHCQT